MRADGEVVSLRASGLGDLVTAVPALLDLRRAAPGRTTLLTSPWLCELAVHLDVADRVRAHQGTEPVLHAGPVALAVNLHGSGPESHRALLAAQPTELWAHAHPAVPESGRGPRWQHEIHEVDRWRRLLSHFGVVARDGQPARPTAGLCPVGSGVTVVHAGAGAEARRWPADRWGDVVRRLARDDHEVVVTGSVADRPRADRVCRRGGLSGGANLAGRLSLPQLSDLVARARLVLSADSGAVHLADLWSTPLVALYGPSPPSRWGPYHDRRGVLWRGPVGAPNATRLHSGLASICVDEVVARARVVDRAAAGVLG